MIIKTATGGGAHNVRQNEMARILWENAVENGERFHGNSKIQGGQIQSMTKWKDPIWEPITHTQNSEKVKFFV